MDNFSNLVEKHILKQPKKEENDFQTLELKLKQELTTLDNFDSKFQIHLKKSFYKSILTTQISLVD